MSEERKYPRVWVFDINRRIYRKPEPGQIYSTGGPIYREHWEERKVVGETSRSWVLSCGRKIPKKRREDVCFSEEEVDDKVWVNDHRYKIMRKVESVRDPSTLKAIAELVGYRAES